MPQLLAPRVGDRRVDDPQKTRTLRPVGIALLVLAGALVANTVAGPLVLDRIRYPISETMLNQMLGLELVTLLVVVPLASAAGLLALREHPLAPLLAIGPGAYAAYMFVQYVVGPTYEHYSAAVVLQLAIAATAGMVTVWCWVRASEVTLPLPTARTRHLRTAWLAFLGAFVVLRYAATLAGAVTGGPIPREFADAPAFYWSIFLLDLGVVVPATFAAAAAVHGGRRLSQQAYYAVIGWFALVPPSVAAMAAVMVARDDPYASWPTLVLTGAASVLFAIPAVAAVRRLSRTEGAVGS